MKELSIEEKAKRYDEAIAHAKLLLKTIGNATLGNLVLKNEFENMFPELKESEDERIRGAIIDHLKDNNLTEWAAWLEKQKNYIKLPDSAYTSNRDVIEFADKYSHTVWENLMDKFKKNENYSIGCNDVSDIVLNAIINTYNWLKTKGEQKIIIPKFKVGDRVRYKGHVCDGVVTEITDTDYICGNAKLPISTQDKLELIEQKPTDKVKPKFKVGDWLVHNERKHVIKVVNPTPMVYEVVNILGYHHTITDTAIENNYHLWTIQDAKDGDVLYINNTMSESIMIYKSFNNGIINKHASYNKFGFEGENYLTLNDGYIIPATKEQRDLLFQKMHEAGYMWDSEKLELKKIIDEKQIKKNLQDNGFRRMFEQKPADSYCQENCKGFQEIGKCFADGECKAKRETEQRPTQEIEPFEAEHGKYYYCIKDYFCGGRKQASKGDVIQALRGLPIMGLKDASEYFLPVNFIKCNSAWSEKDSYYRNHIIQIIEEINNAPLKRGEDWEAYINWLKSLRPQNKWKPSEEMIEALGRTIPENVMEISEDEMLLGKLYQGLKYGRVLSEN